MKKILKGAMATTVVLCMALFSCGPNDDKNLMDQEGSGGEGAIDSSRLTHSDSSSAYITVPESFK